MKVTKRKSKSLKSAIWSVLVVLFSIIGSTFSYLYGASNSEVELHSSLMVLDQKVKDQDINFLHGYYELSDSFNKSQEYDENLELQHKTIYKHLFYNSYLLSTEDYVPNAFTTSVNKYKDTDCSYKLDDFNLAMVRNFWDYQYMESIGLPLFFINEANKKNRINLSNPSMEGIIRGCYISASNAYEIAMDIGLIDESHNDIDSIKNAFNWLISDDNLYYLSLKNEDLDGKFLIRNIYIDEDFSYLLNKDQKSISSKQYGNYYKSFSYWNKNTILAYCPEILSKGSTLFFDIRGSYNNINYFINDVVGTDYSKYGGKLHFRTQTEDLVDLSAKIDDILKAPQRGRILYFVLSCLFFELLLIANIFNLSFKSKNKFGRIFKLLLPILSFVLLWTVLYFFLLKSSAFLFVYTTFNYIGNAVTLIFMLLTIVTGIIWGSFDEEDEDTRII